VGFAEVLDDFDLGEADRFADLIERSGNQLLDTIDSVLDLSKLEAGSVRPDYESTDVIQEVTEAIELVAPRADEADLTLRTKMPSASITAELDRGAFRRILHNLLSNAIKFTDAGGTVTVRTREAPHTVEVDVEDTGVGIDDDFMPALFDAFEQPSDATADAQGTGLGLAVTQRLVRLMDGTIEVESTKGEGTCFTVRLPRDPNAES
jgi:signal transduction histidine kinase